MDWLLRVSGQAVVLVILIALVQALGREKITARWRYALWLLLVVRLALPVQVPSRFSLFNLTQSRPEAASVDSGNPATSLETARTEAATTTAAEVTAAATTAAPSAGSPALRSLGEQQGDASASVAGGWEKWLSLLWLAGATVLVFRIALQNLLFSRRLRCAPTVTNTQAWQTLEDCRQLMEVRHRLVLVETEMVQSPALYGFLRLYLLLPKNTLATLSTEELRYVFLHELAHVKRRDMLVNWVVTILQVLHWFNPLVWLGFRRMAADRELAADALALSHLEPRENVAYGSAILKLLQSLMRPALLPGLVGILEDKSQMKRRMIMIAKFEKTNRWPVTAALAFACISLVALTDARSESGWKPVKLKGKPAADLAVLRVWSCTNGEMSVNVGTSADGRWLSYPNPHTAGELMVRDLVKRKDQRVVRVSPAEIRKGEVYDALVSPDGSKIVYSWEDNRPEFTGIRVIERDGTGARLLYQKPGVAYYGPVCWSADGAQIVAFLQIGMARPSPKEIVLVSVRDGSARVIKTLPWDVPGGVSLDPSGRFLTYDTCRSAMAEREVRLVSIQGGEEIVLLGGPSDNRCLGWSPDGGQLLFTSNRRGTIDLYVQPVEEGKAQGAPALLKASLGSVTRVGITRSGGLYYRADADSTDIQIAKIDLVSGEFVSEPKPLTGRYRGHDSDPQWSPDGKQLAYISSRDNGRVLCIRSMDTGEERDYALKLGDFHNLAWSADGKSIGLSTSHVHEQPGTFRVDLATGEARRVDQSGTASSPATSGSALSSDGKVTFRRTLESPTQFLAKNLQSGEEKVLYTFPKDESYGGGWRPSPNRQYLAFGCNRDEGRGWRNMLKFIPAAGGEARELMSTTNNFSSFGWLSDSRQILCCTGSEFWLLSIDGQAPRKLRASLDGYMLSIHPDGQQLAFVTIKSRSELWLMENAVPALGKAR
jgi:beta-lactamase regulating signal transducer with metallopeptidase domain/Tol biopolymer transport system component